MARKVIEVDESLGGKTVLRVLHDRAGVSHSGARGLVAAGAVARNGRRVERGEDRVAPGDRIELDVEPGRRYRAAPARPRGDGYRIVHEDADLVVVDKAPGLLAVPAGGARGESLEEKLVEGYRKRGHRDPFVRAVHRIDRYTSGLVAFARSPRAREALRKQFASGRPERVYLAVAEGRLPEDSGRLVHHLAEHPKSLKVHAVRPGAGGRLSACSYRVIERFEHATLVEVRLETGRRNQIRVQFAASGHPLVGDPVYGSPSPLLSRSALHAGSLAFEHPVRGGRVECSSERPADLSRLIARLRRGAQPRPEQHDARPEVARRKPTRPRGPGRRYT